MTRRTPDKRDENMSDNQPAEATNPLSREKSLTVIINNTHLQKILSQVSGAYSKLCDKAHNLPLAYKLSFFITVLVVSCMILLGVMLVQQQTTQWQSHISEQGRTLARLMAQSTREPLLADDQLALDAIADSFSNSGSVLGTVITALNGEVITHAGPLHEENNLITRQAIQQIIRNPGSSASWEWQPLSRNRKQTVMSFVEPVIFQDVTTGYALVTFSQTGIKHSIQQAVRAITGATLLIIALGIGMAFVLGQRITQPIDRLVDASRAIGSGDYSFRFEDRRKDELGLLMQAFNEMAEGMLEKSQVRDALSRYVSPSVARQILSNLDDVGLSGKRIDGSVLFADISGFTKISEQMKPEDLVSILNRYFSLVTNACEMNQGIVDKYMGDGVMLVFGAPEPDEDHAFHATCCAILIQKLIAIENRQREEQGLFPVQFRIGINTGSMLAGNMGSRDRMEYTVVGDTVNLASRLCGITNCDEIVISREMYFRSDIQGRVLAGEYQSIRLRGISEPVSTYRVEQLTADYQEIVDTQLDIILQNEADDVSH